MKTVKINDYSLQITNKVDDLLQNYQPFYTPKRENVFRAYELCAFKDVKVVIIGQDPYPTEGVADGLCFSVNKDKEIPKSLANIFKVLKSDLNIIKENGNLDSWAMQGVLLINSVLTNEVSKTNAHKNIGWENMTKDVVKNLSTRGKVIFVLLGNYAQKYEQFIDKSNNTILKTSHPSPLGAYRGFNEYNLFLKLNDNIKKYNYKEIKW